MKKIVTILLFIAVFSLPVIGLSYNDNEFQVKSRQYSRMATKAFDEGDYDKAIEYSKLAEDYAQKSYDYIQKMLARTEAEEAMNRARTRFSWAKDNAAEDFHPDEFAIAEEALQAGTIAFDNENYDVAVVCAHKVLEALGIVTGDESDFAVLPSEFKVRTWRGEKDCLWNIAKNPAIYNDAFKWRLLYEANKQNFPDPDNPNWIEPGLVLTIPKLDGEVRCGMYDSSVVYESLDEAIKNVKEGVIRKTPCDKQNKQENNVTESAESKEVKTTEESSDKELEYKKIEDFAPEGAKQQEKKVDNKTNTAVPNTSITIITDTEETLVDGTEASGTEETVVPEVEESELE